MNWVRKTPVMGDMLRVEMGSGLYHFGIYVTDEEVIQFGLAPNRRAAIRDSEVEVLTSDLTDFLAGGILEVCEFTPEERKGHRTPEGAVAFARSKLGMRGYHIIYNNCEHFANECVTGVGICRQAEDVRALFRSLPVVDVYISQLPEQMSEAPLECSLRQAEVMATKDPLLQRQRYYVWKLLAYGLERSLGKRMRDMTFEKSEKGFYTAQGVYFSLSHSGNALAVAVSRKPVGVDVELVSMPWRQEMAQRSMLEGEYEAFNALPEEEKQKAFVKFWSVKEALFKASCGDVFVPAQWDTTGASCRSFEKCIAQQLCYVSVATDTPEKIRVFENIKLQ